MYNDEKYISLIFKLLNQDISISEKEELQQWVESDIHNLQLFETFKKIWAYSAKENFDKEIDNIDIDDEWNHFQKKANLVNNSKSVRLIRMKSLFIRIAAVFILIFLLGGGIFLLTSNKEIRITASNVVIDKQLEDGSMISLNTDGEVIISSDFNKKVRKIKLLGEAYFKVAKSTEKPFVVQTQSAYIEVVGTEFYVNSSETQTQVIVNSGVVLVYQNKDKSDSVRLKQNESLVREKSGKQSPTQSVINQNYIAWKTMSITFDNTPFNEVIQVLEKTYRIEVFLENDAVRNCRISGKFDNQSIESVLKVLQAVLDIEFEVKLNKVYIKGKGC